MDFDKININDTYEIDFIDQYYPCDCACHSGENIMHCLPCCTDRSYSGPALCLAKSKESNLVLFATSSIRALIIKPVWVKKRSKIVVAVKPSFRKSLKQLAGFN